MKDTERPPWRQYGVVSYFAVIEDYRRVAEVAEKRRGLLNTVECSAFLRVLSVSAIFLFENRTLPNMDVSIPVFLRAHLWQFLMKNAVYRLKQCFSGIGLCDELPDVGPHIVDQFCALGKTAHDDHLNRRI